MLPTPLCHMSVFTQPFKQSPWLPTCEAKDRQQGSPIFLLLSPNFCLRKCKLNWIAASRSSEWVEFLCVLWKAIVSGETYLLSHLELAVSWYQSALWTHKKEKKTQHIQMAIHPPTLLPTHPQLPIKSSALNWLSEYRALWKASKTFLLSTPPDNLFRYEWSFQPMRRKKKKVNHLWK